mgnify:CR=1 FL=1
MSEEKLVIEAISKAKEILPSQGEDEKLSRPPKKSKEVKLGNPQTPESKGYEG